MKHGNMAWLIWKEYRQNRLIGVMALILVLGFVGKLVFSCSEDLWTMMPRP